MKWPIHGPVYVLVNALIWKSDKQFSSWFYVIDRRTSSPHKVFFYFVSCLC